MWVKLFMGGDNLNNIAKVFKTIVCNYIEENKTYNFSN